MKARRLKTHQASCYEKFCFWAQPSRNDRISVYIFWLRMTVCICVLFQYGVGSSGGICEPITIPICQGLSYNQTITPNLLGHTSQREAVMKMSFFNSIVQTVCSVDIRLFVCMVYAPRCVAGEVQRPCRSFCERAKQGCESLMTSFGVSWPNELRCESFPEEMCISVSNGHFVDEKGIRRVWFDNGNLNIFWLLPFFFLSQEDSRPEVFHLSLFKQLKLTLY